MSRGTFEERNEPNHEEILGMPRRLSFTKSDKKTDGFYNTGML